MVATLPSRNEVNPDYTWNAESMFATPEAWEAEADDLLASLPDLTKFQGRLFESATILADALETRDRFTAREQHLTVYAGFSYSVDTTDQNAAAMASKARNIQGQLAAAAAFINPELLAIGERHPQCHGQLLHH